MSILIVLLSLVTCFTIGNALAADDSTGMAKIKGSDILPSDPMKETSTVNSPIKTIISYIIVALLGVTVIALFTGGIQVNIARLGRTLRSAEGWITIATAVLVILVVAVAIPTVIRIYNDYMAK